MKTTFPRILATTALCLAAVGMSSCVCNPGQNNAPVALSSSAKEDSAHAFCCATSVDEQKKPLFNSAASKHNVNKAPHP